MHDKAMVKRIQYCKVSQLQKVSFLVFNPQFLTKWFKVFINAVPY